jgi:hypothetical protein
MPTTSKADLIRETIDADTLADYLTADSGDWFVVWADGTTSIMDGSTLPGREQDARIVATVRCPGIGNADMTWWRGGWGAECADLDDEEVIRRSCAEGDVAGEVEDLVGKLIEDAGEGDVGSTWCVCGQESGNDPWEPVEDGFASEDEARDYLRDHHREYPGYTAFYVDREDNDGHAEAYFERLPDGALAEWQGPEKVAFAD